VAGNTNKLVAVDPATGRITRTLSSPTVLGPSDLDFDGADLWLSSGTGEIFRLDRTSGGIQRTFQTFAEFGRDNGVAFRPGELWVGELFGGMQIQDPATGNLLGMAVLDSGRDLTQDEVGSSCFVAGQLVIASRFGITMYDLTPVR
jgi:hypothetical protein